MRPRYANSISIFFAFAMGLLEYRRIGERPCGEVFSGHIVPIGLVEHRDMRRDSSLFDRLGQHGRCAVYDLVLLMGPEECLLRVEKLCTCDPASSGSTDAIAFQRLIQK